MCGFIIFSSVPYTIYFVNLKVMKGKKTKQIETQLLSPRENPIFFGHEDIVADMFSAYNNSNMPGGWLISGPTGIGKATLAYRFAKFILYHGGKKLGGLFEDNTSADLSIPQNSPSFSKVSNGTHPDLLVLEAGIKDSKSISGDILVEDARKIGSFLHLTSSETPYRIVIIDSIDNMNVNAANSILKLLEEPPANAMFILISHAPGRLLPTIRSRCRQIRMHKPDRDTALKIFREISPDASEDIALSLIELASGSPGGAYDLYVNKGVEIYDNIISILAYLPKLDIIAIQKLGESISGKTNKHSWHIFRVLLNKIVMDIARQTALNEYCYRTLGKENNAKFKLSVAIGAEKLVERWQDINNILENSEKLHLERKAMLVRIFGLLGEN